MVGGGGKKTYWRGPRKKLIVGKSKLKRSADSLPKKNHLPSGEEKRMQRTFIRQGSGTSVVRCTPWSEGVPRKKGEKKEILKGEQYYLGRGPWGLAKRGFFLVGIL